MTENITGPEEQAADDPLPLPVEPDIPAVTLEKVDENPATRFVYSVATSAGGRVMDAVWNLVDLRVGDLCVIKSREGLEFGRIAIARRVALPCQRSKELPSVFRKATEKDIERSKEILEKERDAIGHCRRKIIEMGLDMSLSRVHFTFDGLKSVFYFTAEGRVDFRDLVRELARFTGLKVEMRQIGVRDEARLLGGCGPCGGELCCSSFLNDFSPVSIRMAKDQSLSLNPAKISGVCGRLMCCLSFEHNHYREMAKKAPKMGKMVTAPSGILGKVIQLNLLKEKVTLAFPDGPKEEFSLVEVRPRSAEGTLLVRDPLEVAAASEPPEEEYSLIDTLRAEARIDLPKMTAPPERDEQKPRQEERPGSGDGKGKSRKRKKKRGRGSSGQRTPGEAPRTPAQGESANDQKRSPATDDSRRSDRGRRRSGQRRRKPGGGQQDPSGPAKTS